MQWSADSHWAALSGVVDRLASFAAEGRGFAGTNFTGAAVSGMRTSVHCIDRARIIWETIDGETLIVDTDSGFYYSLDEVGSAIWNMLANDRSEEEIVAAIDREYEVEDASVRHDVRTLIDQLAAEQLIVER